MSEWQVDAHSGLWIDEQGNVQHSEFLERMLRVVSKHDELGYREFAVGAADAVPVKNMLNKLESEVNA